MKIAFCRSTGSVLDKMIAARTNGEFVHCELLFADGTTFSSQISDGGTRFTNGSDLVKEPNLWDIVDLGLDEPELALRAWCTQRAGLHYDTRGIVDFFLGLADHDQNVWFCSEICLAGIQAMLPHVFPFLVPAETSPQELWIASKAYSSAKANVGVIDPAVPIAA